MTSQSGNDNYGEAEKTSRQDKRGVVLAPLPDSYVAVGKSVPCTGAELPYSIIKAHCNRWFLSLRQY